MCLRHKGCKWAFYILFIVIVLSYSGSYASTTASTSSLWTTARYGIRKVSALVMTISEKYEQQITKLEKESSKQ